MTDTKTTIQAFFFAIIGAGICLFLVSLFKGCGPQVVPEITENNIIDTWRDEQGRSTATASTTSLTLAQLRANKPVVDSLERELKTKLRNLTQVTTVHMHHYDTIRTTVHDTVLVIQGDTVEALVFYYQDEWMPHLKGTIGLDSVWLEYSLKSAVSVEQGTVRSKWYKRKETLLTITALNPNATVDRVQSITIVNPVKWYETRAASFAAGFLTRQLVEYVPTGD